LKDNSIFIFDLNGFNYYKISNHISKKKIGNDVLITEQIFNNLQLTMNMSFFVKQSGELYKLYEEKHIQKGYKYKYLLNLIKENL